MIVVFGAHTAVGRATLQKAAARGDRAQGWRAALVLEGATVVVCGCPDLSARRQDVPAWLLKTGRLLEQARDQGARGVVARSWIGAARGHATPMFDAARGLESLVVDAGLPYVIVRFGLDAAALQAAVPRCAGRPLLPGPGTRPLPFHDSAAAAQALLDEAVRPQLCHGVAPLTATQWQRPADVAAACARGSAGWGRTLFRQWRALRPWFTDPLAGPPLSSTPALPRPTARAGLQVEPAR